MARVCRSIPFASCAADMCCCCCCGLQNRIFGDTEEYGPTKKRVCTDIPFLVLFLLFWAGMIAVAATAFHSGDINRLTHGIDMYGNMCGYSNKGSSMVDDGYEMDLTHRGYLYWPNPLDMSIQLCVAHCPDAYASMEDLAWMLNPFGDQGEKARQKLICMYNVTDPTVDNIYLGECFPPYKADSILGRCAPDLDNVTLFNDMFAFFFKKVNETIDNKTNQTPFDHLAESLVDAVNHGGATSKVMADITKVWWIMLLLCVVAVALSWLALFVLRFFTGVIVWATIILVLAAMLALTALLWFIGGRMRLDLPDNPNFRIKQDVRQMNWIRIVSYVMVGVDFVMIVVIIFLRNRIRLAVQIIKEASKALARMPLLTWFPFLTFAAQLVLYAYWLVVSMYLATAALGQDTLSMGVTTYKANISVRYLALYHLFGLLWTNAFILAIGETTIAGAVSFWYWCHDKKVCC
eukprot:TRINITY_DN4036_c0_g3_i3.p1 TRINITY_DN4036_c0_g3~~TRINITY_DN4036_c0_g3_i3.p1  ORF type:complete len:497 (+),score=119.54 TRINITY_DN4036_c0_g3_i3:104-1492(+)